MGKLFRSFMRYFVVLLMMAAISHPAHAVTLSMDSVSGTSSSQVVLSIKVYGFTDLYSIQGTVQFDPAIASFVQVETFGLPGMNAANFGTTFAAIGRITFSWNDANLTGVSVPDGTVIFSIRLTLVGSAGQQGVTSFVNTPTLIEITDNTFNPVPFTLQNGLIQIIEDCANITCDDNNACTGDSCSNGNCLFPSINCSDGNGCTDDACFAGSCVHTLNCNDGNPCTIDQCVNSMCRHANAAASADSTVIRWWFDNCCCR